MGELDPQVLSLTGVNPVTRNTTQVTVEDVEKMIESFEIWMSDDVTRRKEIIENELNKVTMED